MGNDREAFEAWYSINAFDYAQDPIGSRDCALQWKAWQAALASERAKLQPELDERAKQAAGLPLDLDHEPADLDEAK